MAKYPTEPLKCWNKAKELREQYYLNYATRQGQGRHPLVAARPGRFDAIPAGLGDDVYPLTGEPYAAGVAHDKKFTKECLDAAESAGFARDLCAYMRIYWGCMHLNKYLLRRRVPQAGLHFPDADLLLARQVVPACRRSSRRCRSSTSMSRVGAYKDLDATTPRLRHQPVARLASSSWRRSTGRKYDDELFIQAVKNEMRATSLLGGDLRPQQGHAGAARREDHVLAVRAGHAAQVLAVVRRLLRGVSATRSRTASPAASPPCPTSAAASCPTRSRPGPSSRSSATWRNSAPCRSARSTPSASKASGRPSRTAAGAPRTTPMEKGIEINTRDQALRLYADWNLSKPQWQHFFDPRLKTEMMKTIVKEWERRWRHAAPEPRLRRPLASASWRTAWAWPPPASR